jgi:hypothetical protein
VPPDKLELNTKIAYFFAAQGATEGAGRELTKFRHRRLCIFAKSRQCIALLTKNLNCRVTHPGISVFGAILFNLRVGLTVFFFAQFVTVVLLERTRQKVQIEPRINNILFYNIF